MSHVHQWQSKPPEGDLEWTDRHADEVDLAHNLGWTSPEELQRLRLLLEEDPKFEDSSDWPMVVEWCSLCGITRVVKLVLPPVVKEEVMEAIVKVEEMETVFELDEVKQSCEATVRDACTQTPQRRRRRRGGRGSRMKRLLAFQLLLTEKKGLPLSRLLTAKEADTGFSKRKELKRLQEESAFPKLSRKSCMVVQEENGVKMDLKKEEEECFSQGASAGGSTTFTPRSSQTDVAAPTPDSFPLPTATLSPHPPSPPSYVWLPLPPSTYFYPSPPCALMPGHQWVICGACHSWGSVIMT